MHCKQLCQCMQCAIFLGGRAHILSTAILPLFCAVLKFIFSKVSNGNDRQKVIFLLNHRRFVSLRNLCKREMTKVQG